VQASGETGAAYGSALALYLHVYAKYGVLSRIMHKIMIIRHAEKHQHGMQARGVDENGNPARHELTVRGWQRAGALVQLFAQPGHESRTSAIQVPRSIFASDAIKESPSLRAMHTAAPLAAALGIEVNHHFAEGEESELASFVLTAPSPVLIVWHHGQIIHLARSIAGARLACPGDWPDDRFDVVWILERTGAHAHWNFSQIAQRLLPGDSPDVF
jgi:broad specificity phosphatase PhoE